MMEKDEDGLDPIEALVCDASAKEGPPNVHEGGGYYAERIIRRAIEQGTLALIDDNIMAIFRKEIINTPETKDFMEGVPIEAAHQRERWGSEHDAGKTPFDWFWLIGYLAQKAATSAVAGDIEKAKHHTISTAAALANWHAALSGKDNSMRPGIAEPKT